MMQEAGEESVVHKALSLTTLKILSRGTSILNNAVYIILINAQQLIA